MPGSIRISTFENLAKPMAPPAIPFVRTVVSAYFLTHSYLGPGRVDYRFLVVIPRRGLGAPGETFADRELTVSARGAQTDPSGVGNHSAVFDVTGGNAQGQTAVGELQYLGATGSAKLFLSPLYRLEAGATAQWALLPNLGPGPDLIARERHEVRGWIALGLYAAEKEGAGLPFLFTAEQRGTFIPPGLADPLTDPVALSEVSQLSVSLPLSAGRAESVVPAATPAVPEKVVRFAEGIGYSAALLAPFAELLAPIV